MAARGTAITASEKKTSPRTAPWTFGSRSLGIRSSMIVTYDRSIDGEEGYGNGGIDRSGLG